MRPCSTSSDEATNHFASGWAWLILNNGKLEVTSLHDADTPCRATA